MKKQIVALTLAIASVTSFAQHGHHHRPQIHHHHHGGGGNWVAPLVIGGIIGYAINNSQQPQPQQPPVIVYQQPPAPVYVRPFQDGLVYERRVEFDPNCGCNVVTYRQLGYGQ